MNVGQSLHVTGIDRNPRSRLKDRPLQLEQLEERIAPTVVAAGDQLSFTDSDGDTITVAYYGPDGSSVDVTNAGGGDIGNEDDIGTIAFSNADLSSALLVFGQSSGDTIHIEHAITASGSQDVAVIGIGFGYDGEFLGQASFGDGFAVSVGGTLGVFSALGNIDCDDGGHSITAGGRIGLINVSDITLDSGSGAADFSAADISFIRCNTIYGSTGGAEHALSSIGTAGLTVVDDSGGSVVLKLSGVSAVGSAKLVPLAGGGSVIADVLVTSANTSLGITSSGAGGDVTIVSFAANSPGVTVSGVADTDLLSVDGQAIGSVVNKTVGGDIGGVHSSSDVNLIQTGKLGVFGSIYTGPGNSTATACASGFTTDVDGRISSIKVGEIAGTTIEAASIGSVSTAAGGIIQSDITGVNGIDSISSRGTIVNSGFFAIEPGSSTNGGSITSFSAPMLVGTEVVLLGDLGKFAVARGMFDSTVSTYIDDGLGGHVGGGISSFSAGGMGDGSLVETNHSITSMKIGGAGIEQSAVYAHEGLDSIQVAGDMDQGVISADWGFNSVKVSGDVTHGSMITGHAAGSVSVAGQLSYSAIELGHGSSGSIQIGGSVVGESEGIYVYGDIASITVNGYVFGSGDDIIRVEGNVASVSVNGPVVYSNLHFNSAGSVRIARAMNDSVVSADSLLGPVSVGGSIYASGIYSSGDMGAVSVRGSVLHSEVGATGNIASLTMSDVFDSAFEAGGNLGTFAVTAGDIDHNTSVSVAGNLAGVTVRGVIAGSVTVGGNLNGSILSAGTNAIQYGSPYWFADANGQVTGGMLSVGGTIMPGVVIS